MAKFNTYADAPEEARLAKERWERQQKNAPRTGSAVVDAALRFFDDSTRKLEGGQQLQDYAAGKIDSTQINEEQRPIGSKAILNGKEVYWAGQNYGYQSKGSYDKLMEEGQFRMGQIAGQRLGSDIVSAISPEAKQAVQSGIETAVQAGVDLYYDSGLVRDAVNALQPTLQVVGGAIRLADRGLEAVSRITNTSRFITDEAVMALATGGAPAAARRAGPVVKKGLQAIDKVLPTIDDFTGPGSGMALAGVGPQLSMRGGSVSLQPSTVMKAVTARDPESLRLAGVKTGEDIISPEQAKQLTKRSLKVEKHLAKIDSLETGLIDALDTGADAYTIKRLRANLKKERPKLYSTRSNISVPTPEDPLYYGTAAAKRDRQAVALTEGITETLEEHHLFPKVVSGAFFGKMDELIKAGKAELDDLVLMNRVAIAKGRKPGDYKSGMYILGETPHNEYHTLMKEAGDEFKRNQAEAWAGVVNEAKTVDDLLILWRDTLDNLVVPTAEDIQSYNKLDKLLQDIRSTF